MAGRLYQKGENMNCVIHVKNEKESMEVQDILFAAGKGWNGGETRMHLYLSEPFIFVSTDRPYLTYGCSFELVVKCFGDHKPLDAGSVWSFFPSLPPEKTVTISDSRCPKAVRNRMGDT